MLQFIVYSIVDAEEESLKTRSRDAKAYDLYNWNTYPQVFWNISNILLEGPDFIYI